MSVKVENIEKNVVMLEFEVSQEEFEAAVQKAYIKNVGKYNIPGFRKGKAPRQRIELMYGKGIFYDDALNIVIPESYKKAADEGEINPVDRPEIDVKSMEEGEPVVITAKVTVKPEVKVGKYTKLKVTKDKVLVTEDDILEEIKKDQDKNSRMVTIEDRAVEKDDIVSLDFDGYVDGEQFDGGKAEGYSLTIGSNSFIPGFEDQIIGREINTDFDVNVTFPEDYQAENLAGKEAVFKCKVNEIKMKEFPELDDDFAQDVSEFETLEDYKNDVREKLVKKKEQEADNKFENELIDKIIEGSEIDLPECMIESRIDNIVYDMDMRLQYQGLNIEKYLEYTAMDMESFRGQFTERAEHEVRGQLCIEEIGKLENISATEEEFEEKLNELAASYGSKAEDIKDKISEDDIDHIKKDIMIKKTIEYIVENSGK